jgi:mRNA interferase MazF
MHGKKFSEWMGVKGKLHFKKHRIPRVYEAEMWWASIGENVGTEINGKSQLFTRPVIVLKRLAQGFFFVIPVTTQIRDGTWYVTFKHRGKMMTACLHHTRSMDYRRLFSKIGELDDADFKRIKEGFQRLCL